MKFFALIASAAAIKIDDNSSTFKVQVTSFGQQGNGTCRPGDTATVHYTGKFTDGTVFDTSLNEVAPEPLSFTLGQQQVISCWDQGIAQMQAGEKATLTCPPQMAYGAQGSGKIPPNATLMFDVEVLNCENTG